MPWLRTRQAFPRSSDDIVFPCWGSVSAQCQLCALLGRLFWSADERFLKQFRSGGLATRFKPYSKFPPCFKDVSFWTSPEFSENNLCEVVRSVAGATLCPWA